MKNESTNNSKPISSCDFQPVPFKRAHPASSPSNTTTGDKEKTKQEREREQAEREIMRESFHALIPSLRRVDDDPSSRATLHPPQGLRIHCTPSNLAKLQPEIGDATGHIIDALHGLPAHTPLRHLVSFPTPRTQIILWLFARGHPQVGPRAIGDFGILNFAEKIPVARLKQMRDSDKIMADSRVRNARRPAKCCPPAPATRRISSRPSEASAACLRASSPPLFRRHRLPPLLAYKYPDGATMESMAIRTSSVPASFLPSPSPYSPLATRRVACTDTTAYFLWELPRRQNEIDPRAVPDIKVQSTSTQGLRLHPSASLSAHEKIAGAEDGAATLTPETEMFLPSAGCRRTPPGPRRMDGEASEAERRRRRSASRMMPFGTGSRIRGGGVDLAHIIVLRWRPLRSRLEMRDSFVRDVPAAMECTLIVLSSPSVFFLTLPPPRYRPLCYCSVSCHLPIHRARAMERRLRTWGGEPRMRMGTGTATGEEGEWERERGRDAEESVEVALVGPLASAVGGADRLRLRPGTRAPPSSTPALTGSAFALPYRMLYAVVTRDTVAIYDTQPAGPVDLLTKRVYGFDVVSAHCPPSFFYLLGTWRRLIERAGYRSPDGQCLMLSSRDGCCTLATVDETLPTHHTRQAALQLFHERRSPLDVCEHHSAVRVQKHPPLLLGTRVRSSRLLQKKSKEAEIL
ncbi:hypothetical protein B0H16DRAFT_1731413 [Mycena metata]|uniref:Uncharacterized protein n=1 Tax=Mycena metata TaxID=1033252 RepID=A0AAD7MW20_9AGAR|nr:hypothetical protein B0H16DRAFT_1731413 [Mycena metata]